MATKKKSQELSVADVIRCVDELAPAPLAYSWDRAGLDIGAPTDPVTKVLVALTVTREVLTAARRAKADMIVAHHPLIWDALDSLRSDDAHARLCLDIAAENIACYSSHTSLDVVRGGVNDILFDRLGLTNRAPLFPVPQAAMRKLVVFVPDSHLVPVRDAICTAGAGAIGDYSFCTYSGPGTGTFVPGKNTNPYVGERGKLHQESERRLETIVPAALLSQVIDAMMSAHPYEECAYDVYPLDMTDPDVSLGLRGELAETTTLGEFSEQVCAQLEIDHVRVSGKQKSKIRRVAVMGGAGGGSTPQVPDDIDVFVTGDVKYHEAVDAVQRGLNVIDAGHHGTEKWIVPWLADRLRAGLDGLKVSTYVEPDPFSVVTKA